MNTCATFNIVLFYNLFWAHQCFLLNSHKNLSEDIAFTASQRNAVTGMQNTLPPRFLCSSYPETQARERAKEREEVQIFFKLNRSTSFSCSCISLLGVNRICDRRRCTHPTHGKTVLNQTFKEMDILH